MVTPLGSPQVVSMELHNPAPPSLPPPSYYTLPLVAENFNFPSSVVEFLQDIDVGPRALCKISAARDYDKASWVVQFGAAGLSTAAAKSLHDLFVAAMTPEQHIIQGAIVPGSPAMSATSVGTESSI